MLPLTCCQSTDTQERLERFLARLTVEMMAPSKIGFLSFHRFYCLENSSTCSQSRGNRFLVCLAIVIRRSSSPTSLHASGARTFRSTSLSDCWSCPTAGDHSLAALSSARLSANLFIGMAWAAVLFSLACRSWRASTSIALSRAAVGVRPS